MFEHEEIIFVENDINDTVEIMNKVFSLKFKHPRVSYGKFKKLYPVLIPYENQGLTRQFLIKLHSPQNFNLFKGTKIKRYSARQGIFIILYHSIEAFVTLTELDYGTKIAFSTYFVPAFDLKSIGKILSAYGFVLSVAYLLALIFPPVIPLVGVIFLIAGMSFILLFFSIFFIFPFALLDYFSYRSLFYLIFHKISKNLILLELNESP